MIILLNLFLSVFLVASVPGSHRGLDGSRYGHRRLANLLSSHACGAACSKDYVIAQSSSIGSLGPNKDVRIDLLKVLYIL